MSMTFTRLETRIRSQIIKSIGGKINYEAMLSRRYISVNRFIDLCTPRRYIPHELTGFRFADRCVPKYIGKNVSRNGMVSALSIVRKALEKILKV